MNTLRCLFLFFVCCLSVAQNSAQYRHCEENAVSQLEMNACANDEAKRAEDQLNQIYTLLLLKVKDDSAATVKIKAAQRAWISYRGAYIDAMYPAENRKVEYGSIFPMEEALLRATLARQQTEALRDIVKEH